MGNCEQQSLHTNDFELEMIQAQNQQRLRNLSENKKHAPNSKFAKRSNNMPVLLEAVEKTLKEEIKRDPIKKQTIDQEAVALPVYYVKSKKAYYEGQWFDGHPHGSGNLYYANGSYFQGSFRFGDADCDDGIFIYPDGSFKRGELRDSKFNGKATFNYKENGLVYKGQWKDDLPHGYGEQIYDDGSHYKGEFYQGKKDGEKCQFKWGNGKTYRGPFKNGLMHGHGVLTFVKGKYEGEFVKGLKSGEGKLVTERGEYKGPFVNGEMQGVGEFKWNDDKVYKGEFKNGKLHGRGTIYYPNGQKASGEWIDGENIDLEEIAKTNQ